METVVQQLHGISKWNEHWNLDLNTAIQILNFLQYVS